MKEFWMVYVATGNSPSYRHASEQDARNEAARLAKHTGAKVYVLKAIACCEYQPVVWTEAGDDSGLPF